MNFRFRENRYMFTIMNPAANLETSYRVLKFIATIKPLLRRNGTVMKQYNNTCLFIIPAENLSNVLSVYGVLYFTGKKKFLIVSKIMFAFLNFRE